MAQLQPPVVFTPGQILTASALNAHVSSAQLLPGAITDQPDIGENTVTGVSFTSADGITAIVTSTLHGLSTNTQIDVSASVAVYSGRQKVTVLTANTFSFVITQTTPVAASGTLSYTKASLVTATDSICIYDQSAAVLKEATFGNILNSGLPVVASSLAGNAGSNLDISAANGQTISLSGNTSVTGTFSASGTSTLTGNVTASGTLTVAGNATFSSVGAMKIPTGTTAERPGTAVIGQLRYNSTTLGAEVYNGTTWEEVGGGPFDATGGNKIIAPDAVATTPVTASFTSVDGESVVVTSAGHTVTPGQVVQIVTSVTGYSGDWTVVSANTNDFTFVMTTVAAPNSGSCTYKKAGNYKVHIFTSSGTFVAGTKASHVEVLVVGGGGGGSTNNPGGGGGGGAVVYSPYYNVNASQTITVTVGNGGAANTNGAASVFGTITAGGGLAGSGQVGGASGTGSIGATSNAGGSGSSLYGAGGGGGAGKIGANGSNNSSTSASGGDGGDGFGTSIQGIRAVYGGGGGGGSNGSSFNVDGTGHNGGGSSAVSAAANTGGGGGGRNWFSATTGTGGSGIVIVRYPYWI